MPNLQSLVRDSFSMRIMDGAVGIEIELEGKIKPPTSPNTRPKYWRFVNEASLRTVGDDGEIINHGWEMVLKSPLDIENLPAAWDEYDKITSKFRLEPSTRTSVHVHVNVQRLTIEKVFSVLTAYWGLENILVHMNGELREGNLFCLRLCDADGIFRCIRQDLQNGDFFSKSGYNEYRYGAGNLAAVRKFGSLEFRFLRGMTTREEINPWVEALHRMVTKASSLSLDEVFQRITNSNRRSTLLYFFGGAFTEKIYEMCSEAYIDAALEENVDLIALVNVLLKQHKKHSGMTEADADLDQGYTNEVDPVLDWDAGPIFANAGDNDFI